MVYRQIEEYASKIDPELCDPQMRKNSKLSELLKEFEDVWCKGSEHLLDKAHREHLICFSRLLEGI